MMRKILISIGIFAFGAILAEGFPAGTIVHCLSGDIPIECIQPGALVFAIDSEGTCCAEPVVGVMEKSTNVFIRLQAEDEDFFASPDQLFLLSNNTWSVAVDLQIGDELQRVAGVSTITDFEIIDANEPHAQLYALSVANSGNFGITKYGFCVHNVVPVLVAAGFVAKGAAAVLLEKVTEVAVVGGVGFCLAYMHSRHQDKMREKRNSSTTTGGGGRPPDDPNDPWWKRFSESQKRTGPQKEWKKNTVSKQEFFNDPIVKNNYKSTNDGSRILRVKGKSLEGADRLAWDYTHGDVEAYKNGKHLGSIDPQTKRLYKPAVPNRTFKK